ncbi:MAG: hypothetical protein HYY23_08520 [Verrucomicrobia bacterium]|nr:hypothetical protein [Verrucomicrobiota bacterium]
MAASDTRQVAWLPMASGHCYFRQGFVLEAAEQDGGAIAVVERLHGLIVAGGSALEFYSGGLPTGAGLC